MFFYLPLLPVLAVYIGAAVLPAVILLVYIYQHDTIEKEPPRLLAALLGMGVLAALLSGLLERTGETVLRLLVDPGSPAYTVLLAFLVVAAVEEGMKLWLLRRNTWDHPAFNYRFDGVVYAVFVSLGFAAYENVRYVFRYGLSVALPRALLAVPGHMAFAVFMGVYYGRAKLCEGLGDGRGAAWNVAAGYLWAVLLHGFYDACALWNTAGSSLVFLLFVICLFLHVFRMLRRESGRDVPV